MRIISQDGTIDVPYENYSVNSKETKVFVRNARDNWAVLFAEYSTPEKAKKAMGMLRKAYMEDVLLLQNIKVNLDDYEKTPNWFKEKTVIACRTSDRSSKIEHLDNFYFQFPKDEELE